MVYNPEVMQIPVVSLSSVSAFKFVHGFLGSIVANILWRLYAHHRIRGCYVTIVALSDFETYGKVLQMLKEHGVVIGWKEQDDQCAYHV